MEFTKQQKPLWGSIFIFISPLSISRNVSYSIVHWKSIFLESKGTKNWIRIQKTFDQNLQPPIAQVIGRLFAPSQKLKKWTQPFRQCFELGMGILNALRKIFLVVYGPIFKLQGFECVRFQGKNCVTKMVSNFSKINSGLTKPKKMNKKYQ